MMDFKRDRLKFSLERGRNQLPPGWCRRATIAYRSGIEYALAHISHSPSTHRPVFALSELRDPVTEVESYIPGTASLDPFQKDLEEALYWHGASLGVSTSVLNVPGHHARWYVSLWGARSQRALTRTILSLSDTACFSLTTQGVFAADRSWLTSYAGASTVARVIRTFQDLDVDVYQVTPEEDARHRFDLLLARADWPVSVAVQVKSGHDDRHDFRMVNLAPRSARAMKVGIEALQQETASSWKAAECTVGRVDRVRSKAILPLPRLRELLLRSQAELFFVPTSA